MTNPPPTPTVAPYYRFVLRYHNLFAMLTLTAGRYDDNGPAFAVGPSFAVLHRRWLPGGLAVDIGWGWDHETPVSAWPVLRVAAAPSPGSKNRRTGLYWLGFYTSVCWGPR